METFLNKWSKDREIKCTSLSRKAFLFSLNEDFSTMKDWKEADQKLVKNQIKKNVRQTLKRWINKFSINFQNDVHHRIETDDPFKLAKEFYQQWAFENCSFLFSDRTVPKDLEIPV